MSRSFMEHVCKRRHLVLHMDINKTIIQTDNAGGRSFEDVLNSNAAANVFGMADLTRNTWVPLYGPRERAEEEMSPGIISYDAFVDKLYSEPEGMQALPYEERRRLWKNVTTQRKSALREFTAPDSVGSAFAALVEEQREKMTINKSNGQLHSIIPSFFNLVNFLSEIDWPFTLIFRTFGNDIDAVLEEWQQFVLGEHFCKPSGPILLKMRKKLESTPHKRLRTGCIFRNGETVFFCKGPSSLKPIYDQLEMARGSEDWSATLQRTCTSLPGFVGVEEVTFSSLPTKLLAYFSEDDATLCEAHVGGLVDYYEYWASVGERRCGGKVFPITLPSSSDSTCYSVFFDDNIVLGDERSIVDFRDSSSGASICDVDVEQRYCVAVNAFRAIVEENYFVDELSRCLSLQHEQLGQL